MNGPVTVRLHSYLINDLTTNAALIALVYGGTAIGAPIARAINPPWYTGTYIGTVSFSGRIGNLLISGGPGEVYPQIFLKVADVVGKHAQDVINVGTASDFLGYIIAPLEAYPQIIANVGNDNYLFNISHSLGERLTCSLLRGAGEALGAGKSAYWSQYDRCPIFADDFVKPANADTTFPEQPDLSAVMPHQ